MTHFEPASIIDKRALTNSFSAAAACYDELAVLQQSVGYELLPPLGLEESVVLDLGCGTGYFISHLEALYKKAMITGVDIAPGMIHSAESANPLSRFVCADAHDLPFEARSIDAIYSNLMFQWSDDLLSAFSECRRVLAPGGCLRFSILTKNTMKELHHSWKRVSSEFCLMQFNDASNVESFLCEAGFNVIGSDARTYQIHYPSVKDFFMAMKRLGSKNHSKHRGRGLLTKSVLNRVAESYEAFRTGQGMLPVTYEVLFVYAR